MTPQTQDIPFGFCHCGCGQKTTICASNYPKEGLRNGDPRRFVAGHQFRKVDTPEYHEEDRGFRTPCWIWDRRYSKWGYGQKGENRVSTNAHIVYWKRKNGPVPEGCELHHMCEVRACANPDHVTPLTRQEHQQITAKILTGCAVKEIRDLRRWGMGQREIAEIYGVTRPNISMVTRGVTWDNYPGAVTRKGVVPVTHCKRGHEFTPENTHIAIQKNVSRRVCRACMRQHKRDYRAKNR